MAPLRALPALPPNYKKIRTLEIDSRRTFITLNLLAVIPLLIGLLIFSVLGQILDSLGISGATLPASGDVRMPLIALTLVGVVVMLSIHELCHGIAFQMVGAHPRYGVNLRKLVAFAAADTWYLPRNAYLIVSMAPLVILSVVTILLMIPSGGWLRLIVALLGAANAGGAIGDLWFTRVCRRYGPELLIRDFGDGAELFLPRNRSRA